MDPKGYVAEIDEANVRRNKKNILPQLADVEFDPAASTPDGQSGHRLVWNKERSPTVEDHRGSGPRNSRARSSSSPRCATPSAPHDEPGSTSVAVHHEQFNAALNVGSTGRFRPGQAGEGQPYKEDLINEPGLGRPSAGPATSSRSTPRMATSGFRQFLRPGAPWPTTCSWCRRRQQENAETLMDYYYRPDVAAQVAAYVNYICPVQGRRRRWRRSTRHWPRAMDLPSEATLNAQVFRPLTPPGAGRVRRRLRPSVIQG